MKQLITMAGLLMVLGFTSCLKKDNLDGPNASLEGNLLVAGTKNNFLTTTGSIRIKLEQLSYSETPAGQEIPSKIDGTYKNSKLFKGHYRVTPIGGAFWPVLPVEIDIDGGTKQDFELTPYAEVINFTAVLNGRTLTLKCDIQPTITAGLPVITEIQPYVNTTKIVGPGAALFEYSDMKKITVSNGEWEQMPPAQKSPEIVIEDMVPGRTFYVRMGVRYNDSYKSSNLSDIIEIKVPQQ